MPDWFTKLYAALERLTSAQKIQIVVAVVGTAGLVWGTAYYATRVRYDVLFSGMAPQDASEIVEMLRERNVPYRIHGAGGAIEVPANQVDELRIELAGEGLPRGGGVGFEIFDRPSFGLSDFVQNVNYRRALERELGRSIQSIDTVESARVHLALPAESVFADEKREASASVVVRLKHSGTLSADRVSAITHLVASGVEGLDPARVSVLDGEGRMLTDGREADPNALSGDQLEAKHAMESHLESTLLAILEPVVGAGKVRARASVELKTARVERVEEVFDPDSAVVRSEQKAKMRNGSGSPGGSPGGVPGTASNLPDGAAPPAQAETGSESQSTTTNFEINKTVATFDEPRGGLLRQSVAVVVDNVTTTGTAADGSATTESEPRSDEEMRKITDLVRAAAGVDTRRGDVLIVENVPFDEAVRTTALPGGEPVDWVHMTGLVLRYLGPVLLAALIVLFVVRPGIRALGSVAAAPAGRLSAHPTVAELQAQLAAGGRGGLEGGSMLRQKLIEAAAHDPESAALVVRGWLQPKGSE